jgi:uncharacterized protein
MDATTTVRDNAPAHRYEVAVDGEVAGFVQYRARPGLIALIHTEIDGRMGGRGLGSTLIGAVLEDARAKGLAVLPFCPFANAYIKRHPEDRDLVPREYWGEFDLGA